MMPYQGPVAGPAMTAKPGMPGVMPYMPPNAMPMRQPGGMPPMAFGDPSQPYWPGQFGPMPGQMPMQQGPGVQNWFNRRVAAHNPQGPGVLNWFNRQVAANQAPMQMAQAQALRGY